MKRRSFLAASGAIAASSLLPTLGQAQTANPLIAPWIGPFGGVWIPVQADADALAAKYGKVEMALHAATIDAFNA